MQYMYRTVVEERQFEAICQRILNAKKHFANTKQSLIQLKCNKPKAVSHHVRILGKWLLCGVWDYSTS